MKKSFLKTLSFSLAALVGIGGLIGLTSGSKKENVETKAAENVFYTHTFAAGDFKTDMWWGVDGGKFWANALSSIQSDGGTFTANEYLWRFGYKNTEKNRIDNIYIPIHFTGDVEVVIVDRKGSGYKYKQYYKSGDNAIVVEKLGITLEEIEINVNERYKGKSSTTRILYGETARFATSLGITVTLNANGGSGGPGSVEASLGEAMPALSSLPTRTGYTFLGYFDQQSGGTKYYNANGSSAKSWDKSEATTLYAHWQANTYTVSYIANKPSNATSNVTGVPSSHSATYDANVTLGSAPSLTGWTFGGWYKESGCTNKVGNAGQTVSKPNLRSTSGTANLYAKWTANTYTIKYNGNKPSAAGGNISGMPSDATWTYDNNATLASSPSLTGWTFGGWYKDQECTEVNKLGDGGAVLTKPNLRTTSGIVNLYAKWTPNTYTVRYNGNKPAYAPSDFSVTGVPGNDNWTYDTNATLGSAPSITGYVFDGWYKEAACTNKVGNANEALIKPNLTPTNATTVDLYAKWKFNDAVQDVINRINETKTCDYNELTDKIDIADNAYNNLDDDLQKVIISEGYKDILDNAKAADAAGQLIEDLGVAQNTQVWRDLVSDARSAYNALIDNSFIPASILQILLDDEAAIFVMDKINAIGDPHWTDPSKDLIDDAQSAYDSYIAAGHPAEQIANHQALVDANDDYDKVDDFVHLVNEIVPSPYIYSDELKDKIDDAREWYDLALSEHQHDIVLEDDDASYHAHEYYELLVNYEKAYEASRLIDAINDIENTPECKAKIEEARAALDALDETSELPLVDPALVEELEHDEAAFAVIELINAIYPMSYGKPCEDAIKAAREAYDALSEYRKTLVVNYDMLLKAENDYAKVKEVVEKVDNIGDIRYDQNSSDKISDSRDSYEALSKDQKDFFPSDSLQEIVDHEIAYETLGKIYVIGDVAYDSDSEEKINEARELYDSLTDAQKRLIQADDLSVLTKSEENYGNLRKKANILVISLLIFVLLAIAGGVFFLIFLLKRRKNEEDKGTVKVASVGGLLPAVTLASHYLDAPFIALFVLSGVAVLLWLTILGLVLYWKYKKQAPAPVTEEGCLAGQSLAAEEANAILQSVKKSEEESKLVVDKKGSIFKIRYIKSFTAKLIQSPLETKKYYEELKNEVLSYKKTNSRISWHYDAINSGRNYVLKFVVRGKTLCVYLPLNADDYVDSKYKVEKVESKRFEDVSCLYRIKNDRRLGYAKELIAVVASNLGLEKGEEQHEVYSNLPYEPNKPLVVRGLIKEQKIQVNKPATKPAILESKTNSDGDEVMVTKDASGNIFEIRYIKSFTAKLSQSENVVKDYYTILKNYALSYKESHSRVSWHYDAINVGRDYVLKFAIRGKTLCVYFALDASKLDEKYKVEVAKGKRFEDTPCLYRIKNDCRCEYAKELIDEVMKKVDASKGEEPNEDYRIAKESTRALLEKGLIKELKTKVVDKKVVEHYESISVSRADELMSDDKAESSIETVENSKVREGKKDIINIDTLSNNFNNGDEVTLDALIEKGLVSPKVGYIKILARGELNKKLTVIADDFSIQAVKMIVLTGGRAKKIHE